MSRAIQYLIAGILFLGVFGLLYYFDPLKVSFFPRCPLYLLTELHCPGCGSLRSLHRLFHGDVGGALTMNSLMVLSLPVIGLLSLRPKWATTVWVPWTCFLVLVLYGVLRNVPIGPFAVLAPH